MDTCCFFFAYIPRNGLAGSCGRFVLKGTVLSHPHSREPARKGEVIKKVKCVKD